MVARERLVRFGAEVRSIRVALGLGQRALARRIDRSQGCVSLVERGNVAALSVAEADRIARAIGATLVFGVEAPVLLGGARQRDAAHARCVAYVARRLAAAGWIVRREVAIGTRERPGWIDVLAFNPETRVLLVIEVKTDLVDIGGLERQLGWYHREARNRCRDLGWDPSGIVATALILATVANDDRIRANAVGLRQVFPRRWRDLMSVIGGAQPDGAGWVLAMIDPRSRVRLWCRPTVVDGRRSLAPYRHIADFLRPR
jgi:transcriptional regulator with XRE-family HTH domain